jgi:hypothetical protein
MLTGPRREEKSWIVVKRVVNATVAKDFDIVSSAELTIAL